MATPSGGKIRPKRSHNARKPYERPRAKSLLARVSDSVKDFITPSWINNLWINPNDDDGEDSDSRSSTPEPPQQAQAEVGTPNFMPAAIATSTPDLNPPRGKEALSVPRPTGMGTPAAGPSSEDYPHGSGAVRDRGDGEDDDVVIIDENQPSTSTGVRQTPLPFRNYANPIGTSTPNEEMNLLGGRKVALDKDDASDTSVSTSGCSSLVPHVDKVDHREKLSKKNLDRLSEMGHSNSLAKSSLWTDGATPGPSGLSTSRQQATGSAKRPSFNLSYFGSPKVTGESRPKHASPFYPGRTQFGGSSAQRLTLKRPRNSPYEVHLPVKRNIRPKPAPVNPQDSLGTTSSTARKILDTLERMSTPLLDAKKIPLSPAASPYSFRPTNRLLRRPGKSRTNDPPVTGLKIAHQASVVPNRQPPVSMVIDLEKEERVVKDSSSSEVLPVSTAAPSLSIAPSLKFGAPVSESTPAVSSRPEVVLPKEKTGGKMKAKSRNTLHYSAQREEEEVLEIPNLPEVALPISKGLPTFNFGAALAPSQAGASSLTTKPGPAPLLPPSSSKAATTSSSKAATTSSSKAATTSSISTTLQSSPAASFTFSVPASSSSSGVSTGATPPQFTFASPIIKQAGGTDQSPPSMKSSSTAFKFSMPRQAPYSTSRPSVKKPSFETPERTRRKGVEEEEKEDIVEVKVADEVEDEEEGGGIKVAKELKTGSCLEAFGILPTKNGPIPSSTTVQVNSAKGSQSRMDNGPLTSGASKKAGAKPLQNDTSKSSNSIFEKFKPAASSWECNMCMLYNKCEASKCVACESPKPGQSNVKPTSGAVGLTKSADSLKPSDSKSSPLFNNSLANKFSKQSNECWIRNKDSADSGVACTTPRPGKLKSAAVETPSKTHVVANNSIMDKFKAAPGEWECDTCMIRNKATISKCVACETPKPGSQPAVGPPPASSFKFGSTPLSNGDATGAFKFGSSSSSSTLNSNMTSTTDSNVSSGGGFKLPPGLSLGLGTKPNGEKSNGITSASSSGGGGFKVPANFSFGKPAETTATTKPAEQQEDKSGGELTFLNQTKTSDKPDSKLEVTVPVGLKFGASTDTSSSTSSIKFGGSTGTGGFKVGETGSTTTKQVSSTIPSSDFKFGQSTTSSEQALLDGGPPPNVTIFQSKVTEGDGPSAKRSMTLGALTAGKPQEQKMASSGPTFNFGAGASTKESTLNPSAAPFQFGSSADTAAFGSTKATDSSVTQGSKQMFSFGQNAASSASSGAGTSTTPSFAFGSSGTGMSGSSEVASLVTATKDNSKPSFQFGTAATTQGTPSSLPFGAKTQESTSTTPAASFTFGQTAASQPSAATSKPGGAPPAYSFGAKTATAPAPKVEQQPTPAAFTFGSQNQNNNQGGSSGFNFGAPSTAAPAPTQTTPAFSFGGAAAPASTTTGGFNFGGTTNTNNAQFTGSTPGFGGGFGSNRSSTNPSPAFGASPAPQSTFTFGAGAAPTTTAASNPFGGAAKTNATPFGGAPSASQGSIFGSAATGSQPTPFGAAAGASNPSPAFGGMTNSTAFGGSSNPSPAFGASTAPAFGSGAANSTAGGFQFGKAAPSFQFGGTNDSAPNATPAGSFQFTGNQQNQAPKATPAVAPQPAGGFNFSSGQPSFNFGGSTPQPGATPFQFQASAGGPENNPFNATGTPGAQSGRKIKRAVRRTTTRR